MRFSERYDIIAFSHLGAVEKAVLYAINRYANDNGYADPRQEDLAPVAGLTEKGLRLVLDRLRDDFKVLEIGTKKAANGISDRNTYTIYFEAVKAVPARVPAKRKPKPVPDTDSNRNDVPVQDGTRFLFEEESDTGSSQNEVPVPNNIEQQPNTTAHLQQPIKNILPDESEPCLPHTQTDSSTQAPFSEETEQERELTHGSSPPEPSDDSEKHGEPTHSTASQTEPAGLTPLPAASRSNSGFEVDDYGRFIKHWMTRRPGEMLPGIASQEADWVRQAIKKQGLGECICVVDWAHESTEKTPMFLRDGGNCEIKTLFNPKYFYRYRNAAVVYRKKKAAIEQQKSTTETSAGEPTYQPSETEIELWAAISESFIDSEGREDVDIWLSPCTPILSSGKLYLKLPNRYYTEWISEHYEERIKVLLKNTGYDWGGFGTPPPEESVETNVIPFKTKEIA